MMSNSAKLRLERSSYRSHRQFRGRYVSGDGLGDMLGTESTVASVRHDCLQPEWRHAGVGRALRNSGGALVEGCLCAGVTHTEMIPIELLEFHAHQRVAVEASCTGGGGAQAALDSIQQLQLRSAANHQIHIRGTRRSEQREK
jgi:hypothetical protein